MAGIYRRGKTWWVAYYVGGELHRKSLKTSNKRIAMREQQALEAELLRPHRRLPEGRNPKVEDFWTDYLERFAQDHKRPRAVERTKSFWLQLLDHTGAQRVGDITRSDIEGFIAARLQKGNSKSTANNALRELKALYNRMIKLGLYTGQNPVQGVEMFPLPRRMPDFHSEEELEHLMEKAETYGTTIKRVVLLCAYAGFRKNEMANARWEWFDFDNPSGPVIHIGRFQGFELKDYEDRSLPMHRRIREEFYPTRKPKGFIFESGRGAKGKSTYRFDPKRTLSVVLREAGLATDKPYQRLRHTFGSLLAQKGVSIFKVSKWMGHSSVQVTERHYAGLQSYDPEIDSL